MQYIYIYICIMFTYIYIPAVISGLKVKSGQCRERSPGSAALKHPDLSDVSLDTYGSTLIYTYIYIHTYI